MQLDAALDARSRTASAPAGSPPSFTNDAEQALAAYRRDGFLIEPALFAEEECAALHRAVQRLAPDRAAPLAPVMNPHRIDALFLHALRHPAIVVILERLLGGPVSGLQSQYFPCVSGTPGFTPHQDNHYVEASREDFASAWIALDDGGAANGALIAYPGSHREPLLPVEEVPGAMPHPTQAFNAFRQRVLVPAGYAPATLEVPRGTVIFLHGHLLHGSHPNRAERPRRALLTTYVRQGSPFRRGASAQRSAIDVYGPGRRS